MLQGGVPMTIDTNTIVSVTEANQNFLAWRASPKRMDRLWFSKITALNICWSIWTIRPWSTWQMTRRSTLWRQEFWRNISPHLYDRRIVSYVIGDRNDNPIVFNTFKAAVKANPDAHPLFHSDYAEFGIIQTGGSQYTSPLYREAIQKYDIQQSMNSAGGRCHDNARCESMWARMKTELLYDRYDTEKMTTDELKTIIWRYFTSYWNNRRICSTNRGLPPMIKRQQYYASLKEAA